MSDYVYMTDAPATNARRVMAAVRAADRIARIDISRVTGLSPATVTSVTSTLRGAGLIEEVAADEQTSDGRRGRPRVALKLRGDAHLVVGAKLSDKMLTATVLNFHGDLIADAEFPVPHGQHAPDEMARLFATSIATLLGDAGLRKDQISAIGFGLPGYVDAATGMVFWCPHFDRREVDFGALLASHFACSIFLDNDANLVAMAELWFGLGRDIRDFIVITLEHGVGMGIVLDGRLYRGTLGRGAEFGHTKVELDGALCRCGQRGCLEAYVGDYALLREAGLVMGEAHDISAEAQLDRLFQKAQAGDAAALSIFRRAGRMFGMGLANVVNIFDPETIILSGASMRYDYLYDQEALAVMRQNTIDLGGDAPAVRVHKWGDLLWAKGAAAMALDGITDIELARMDGWTGEAAQ